MQQDGTTLGKGPSVPACWPGPWLFQERFGKRTLTLKRQHWEVGQPTGFGVALVFGDDDSNARLIAAAPDLFEALAAIVKSLSDQDDEGLIEHAEPMQKARAALAKAGQQDGLRPRRAG